MRTVAWIFEILILLCILFWVIWNVQTWVDDREDEDGIQR